MFAPRMHPQKTHCSIMEPGSHPKVGSLSPLPRVLTEVFFQNFLKFTCSIFKVRMLNKILFLSIGYLRQDFYIQGGHEFAIVEEDLELLSDPPAFSSKMLCLEA